MSIQDSIKKCTLMPLIKILTRVSNENLVRLLSLFKGFAKEDDKKIIEGIKELIKKNHPATKLIRNFLDNYDKKCINKFIENLIIQGLLLNNKLRDKEAKKGNASLSTLLISPTMRCNLNCVGCYANKYDKKDDLDIKVVDRLIKEGKKMGVALYTILGGEPFIKPEMFDIFKKHKDVYFQVYTNGTLIDENVCKKLLSAGNVFPQISIEGFEKETDARRGKGVYKKIMKTMDLLKKYKIPFGFSTCTTRKNVETVMSDKFLDMLIKKGALMGWYFLYMPVCGDSDVSLMPTPKQRIFMLKKGKQIRKAKPIFIIDFWNDAPYVGGCIAGKKYAHITSTGDVEPCIFTHFATDNVKNKSLKECINSPYFKSLRKSQPYSKNLLLPCQWIDHPEISRKMFKKFKLNPTHSGADEILKNKKLMKSIDKYSKSVKKAYQKLWDNHSMNPEKKG